MTYAALVQLDVLEPELAALVGEHAQEVELLLRASGTSSSAGRSACRPGVAQEALQRVGGRARGRGLRGSPSSGTGPETTVRRCSRCSLLLAVTAVWGVTFVQVKDAVAIYPLFAFLAVRFAIAGATLAPVGLGRARLARARRCARRRRARAAARRRLRAPDRRARADDRLRAPASSPASTSCSRRCWRSSLFRVRTGAAAWIGVGARDRRARAALGRERGLARRRPARARGRRRVRAPDRARGALGAALRRRSRSRRSRCWRRFAAFLVVALALGDLSVPHGWTVWGALLVTGIFASALAFLVQTWAQRRTSATRVALVFAMEPVFAGAVRLRARGRPARLASAGPGCAVIMAGIVVAEPAAVRRAAAAAGPVSAIALALVVGGALRRR